MTRLPAVLATIAIVTAGALTAPPADARPRGRAIAAGVMGLAAGAIIGSAARNYYAYEPGYVVAPGYAYEPYAPAYGYAPYGAPVYGYPGYYGYGGSACDRLNYDRQLQGTC